MSKRSLSCTLLKKRYFACDMFRLDFAWPGPSPKAGQFFMVAPVRTSVFLPRPISLAMGEPALKEEKETRHYKGRRANEIEYLTSDTIRFLVTRRGTGTAELLSMNIGEEAQITGPLGNAWMDFLPAHSSKVALVGGGVGIAPLMAFAGELKEFQEQNNAEYAERCGFDFYAGFRVSPRQGNEQLVLSGLAFLGEDRFVLATEDGRMGSKGRVTDFLNPANYTAIFACGPLPMLKAVAQSAKLSGVPCYVSIERHMACGVGACMGCTVRTNAGNKRCCTDGPVFNAEEVLFGD
jgi:NAD(P)H-flavin reductase